MRVARSCAKCTERSRPVESPGSPSTRTTTRPGFAHPAPRWRRSIAIISGRPIGWPIRCSVWRRRAEMDFSVVIATKDRQEYLRRTLESLEGQTHAPPFEVIVIDNGSADETKSVVDACAGRSVPVRYLTEPQPNRGKARNRGAQIAAGRYLLFCDDDVWLPPGWIAAHEAAQEGDDEVVNGPI